MTKNYSVHAELPPEVAQKLNGIKDVPPRPEQTAAQARSRFLSQVQITRAAVSQPQKGRLIQKNVPNQFFWLRPKERSPMFTAISTFFVVIALALGGVTGTVYASQSSQPDDLLYPVKTAYEDVMLAVVSDPEQETALMLQWINRRLAEWQTMQQEGTPVSDALLVRLDNEIQSMFSIMLGLSDEQLPQAMLNLHASLQTATALAAGEMQGSGNSDQALLTQAQDRIQDRLRLVEECLGEPDQIRLHLQEQDQTRDQLQTQDQLRTSQPEGAGGPGSDSSGQPVDNGAGTGNGSGEPTGNGAMDGTGPILQHTCTPTGSGYRNTPQPGGSNGQGGRP